MRTVSLLHLLRRQAALAAAGIFFACTLPVLTTAAAPFPLNLFRGRAEGDRPPGTYVLMINGGRDRERNYKSHLLHIEQLLTVLLERGINPNRIWIFSGDGEDPAPDHAVRAGRAHPDSWLLEGTRLERPLGRPLTYANTTVAGFTLHPATQSRLHEWFAASGPRLRPGDTLLVYVTDHGTKDPENPRNNRITLWGDEESVSVTELGEMLDLLDPDVPVMMLMSQCFSGAFASLIYEDAPQGTLGRRVCGYFSSTVQRVAYGCYPEDRGRKNVGHSFRFIEALRSGADFPTAHARVLAGDRTRDVPLRTSDVHLEDVLRRAAEVQGQELTAFADTLLREAWHDPTEWETEIALLDRVARAFGLPSTRSLAEVKELSARLRQTKRSFDAYAKAWRSGLTDLTEQNLGRFLATRSDWQEQLQHDTLLPLEPEDSQTLAAAFLPQLASFTRTDGSVDRRLRLLRDKAEAAAAVRSRTQVRLAVTLRMRALLTTVAGRQYLSTQGTPEEQRGLARLLACENLSLGSGAPAAPPAAPARDPFPPAEKDETLAESLVPGWMGVRFRQADLKLRTAQALEEGAVEILAVHSDSPAEAAGLAVGDVVIGPADRPFRERRKIREWTMLAPIGEPTPLLTLRGERRRRVTLVPQPYPVAMPPLQRPEIGTPAPPLDIAPYRGTPPAGLAIGAPHLLFFWTSRCAACQDAAEELVAFERAGQARVIAITGEQPERLDEFFRTYTAPFPQTVAVDSARRTLGVYGVVNTPVFILVDGEGRVRSYTTGYSRSKGLGIAGWTWTRRPDDDADD